MSQKNNYKLINQIQKIRAKNNVNWMDMLRLAFKHDAKNASKIMTQIYLDDQKISSLVKKLAKNAK
ncbi:hypothetical protein N9K93_04685 [Candidatus Pelagibacter bacterium]|nr:hypothetical protein [Candidatus Pelagibacter bacterium]MDA9232368.1 hypothetical protein [Candidatus Pelagibacter sp.]|tara:strand:+ start:215 stop:412 length:198 start_codon:yes stop_codon:yes gene_type:complete